MKTYRPTTLPVALMMVAALSIGRADDKTKTPPVKPPTEGELRAGISRGLGYLAKEGDEWMAAKNCNSCHHLPELLWSHREAKRRGFSISQEKFEEWLKWSTERVTEKKPGAEEAALLILAMPETSAPRLRKVIGDARKPDGFWNPAGQFATMQKRGAPDARLASTRLCLIALATPPSETAESDPGRAKVEALFPKANLPTSLESLVFRFAYARRFGTTEEAAAGREAILKQQRGDGGWSSVIGSNMSDPLATGQALYALQPSSTEPRTAAAIARAQDWLLRTQREDGSWPIDITHISRMDRSAPAKAKSFKAATGIYTYWGSSWATIGLLQGVDVVE